MSMTKRLAKYVVHNEADAEKVTTLLNKYGLSSLAKRLEANVRHAAAAKEAYEVCRIYSATALSDDVVTSLKTTYNIPHETPTKVTVDPTVLGGTTVYYQGKKWNDSVKGRLDRFKTS